MRITHKTNSIMSKPLNGSLEECFMSPYCALSKNKKRNEAHVGNCWSRKGALLKKKKREEKLKTKPLGHNGNDKESERPSETLGKCYEAKS